MRRHTTRSQWLKSKEKSRLSNRIVERVMSFTTANADEWWEQWKTVKIHGREREMAVGGLSLFQVLWRKDVNTRTDGRTFEKISTGSGTSCRRLVEGAPAPYQQPNIEKKKKKLRKWLSSTRPMVQPTISSVHLVIGCTFIPWYTTRVIESCVHIDKIEKKERERTVRPLYHPG